MARRQSRVLALRALFAMDIGRQDPETALRQALEGEPDGFAEYARTLCAGVQADREQIDGLIARFIRGWSLPRLAAVDRSLLRLATYELLHQPEIPPTAVVSEAVELASTYSTEDAPRFINGVLARIAEEIGRPLRDRDQDQQEEVEKDHGEDH
ncbi:MAG: transcription antitermination factor NusB [Thermaerobacter sp.]|nr:transcription antitermination factor NusB [Thermaerobacter sp.]